MPDVTVDVADFGEFAMPVYDGDLEESEGLPEGAKRLCARIAGCDALMISTPEYNGGIPGALKNAIESLKLPKAPPDIAKQLAGKCKRIPYDFTWSGKGQAGKVK